MSERIDTLSSSSLSSSSTSWLQSSLRTDWLDRSKISLKLSSPLEPVDRFKNRAQTWSRIELGINWPRHNKRNSSLLQDSSTDVSRTTDLCWNKTLTSETFMNIRKIVNIWIRITGMCCLLLPPFHSCWSVSVSCSERYQRSHK